MATLQIQEEKIVLIGFTGQWNRFPSLKMFMKRRIKWQNIRSRATNSYALSQES